MIILKARQLGISWLVCAYCTWKALFYENAKILLLSQGEEEAFALVDKCRFIIYHLPEFVRVIPDPDQHSRMGLPGTRSEIVALPSTEKAGRSTDATIVVCDEWEFHPYAELNFGALKPTIDAGGQFIGLSTADKTRLNTFFKMKFNEARKGDSNFKAVFLPYNLRPGRDDTWFEAIKKDMKPWQVEQEYPKTEAEALGVLKTRTFFDNAVLDDMKRASLQPIRHEISDQYQSVSIFKPPVIGRRYVVFTDPSDGKEDPHATIVMDSVTGEEVASSHDKLTADKVAQVHDALSRFYNNALNSWETNARAGGIFSEKMKELNTPNQCDFLETSGKLNAKRGKGWWTPPNGNDKFWDELEEAVRLRQITIHSKECIDEFKQFFVPEGQKPCHPDGGHDDYITAWSRVWYLKRFVQQKTMESFSFKYKE
jgi:hypothetical protein